MHKYKKYLLGELFECEKGDVDLQNKDINGRGEIFVNSGSMDCGIKGRTDKKAKIFSSNTITIDFFGNAYYRNYNYKMATHNHVFSLSGNVIKNYLIGLYLVGTMFFLKNKYSYNNMATWEKLKQETIILPVNGNKIDFEYMEQRIKELECERIKELECERIKELSNYLSATGLDNYKLSEKDNKILGKDINTGKFIIGDLFNKVKLSHKKNFDKRIDTTTTKSKEFNLPLINAKMGNNGIMYYARREDFDSISKTIDIIQNGAIATGMVYVQPQDTGILWDAYLLQAKFDVDQRCKILFYIATSIRKAIKPIFNRERKATWSRVQKQSILLPVDEDGNIDFKYMIDYITAIEKITIKDVVQYKDKVIENTKKVIKKTAI